MGCCLIFTFVWMYCRISAAFVVFCLLPFVNCAVGPFRVVSVENEFATPGDGMYTQVRIPSPTTNQLPVISYLDASCGRLSTKTCNDTKCSAATLHVVDGKCNDVNTGRFETQIIGSDGFPFFAYYENFALKVAHCNDSFCSDVDAITRTVVQVFTSDLDSTGHYTSIALSYKQTPIVAYYNELRTELNVASCENIECTSSKVTVIDNNGNTGGYPSIAVGVDKLPLITFYNEDEATLQIAKCGDTECQEPSLVVLRTLDDSSSDIGRYNYLQIGDDNLPIAMYTDSTNGYMKTVHCADVDCTTGTRSIVDQSIGIGAYGEFPEMQINPRTKLPVLSYFNQTSPTTSSLKVTQCLDTHCSLSYVQIISEGKCGYGRDSSLAFGEDYIYVSFLNYSPITYFRKTGLAVLAYPLGAQEEFSPRRSLVSRHFFEENGKGIIKRRNGEGHSREIDDICVISLG